jgi:hypothetical protein
MMRNRLSTVTAEKQFDARYSAVARRIESARPPTDQFTQMHIATMPPTWGA